MRGNEQSLESFRVLERAVRNHDFRVTVRKIPNSILCCTFTLTRDGVSILEGETDGDTWHEFDIDGHTFDLNLWNDGHWRASAHSVFNDGKYNDTDVDRWVQIAIAELQEKRTMSECKQKLQDRLNAKFQTIDKWYEANDELEMGADRRKKDALIEELGGEYRFYDWKEASDAIIDDISEIVESMGGLVLDHPDFEGTDTYGLIVFKTIPNI